MRVLFDAHWWLDGPPSNKEVMKRIVLTWLRVFPQDEVVLAVPAKAIEKSSDEFPTGVRIVGTYVPIQGISAIFELPWVARKIKPDIIIAHNFSPLFGRSAVFIQDFLFLSNPEWFTLKERIYFSLMPWTMNRATFIFSSSITEGRRIHKFSKSGVKPVAIGLAANAELIEAEQKRPEALGTVEGFLLSVGRLNIRKNLETILVAAVKSGCISKDFPLIVVGEPSGRRQPLPQSVTEYIEFGAIRFLGFTSDEELAWLYANASLFIFLSLDEGFGMPPLEASAFGTPMLVSDIPVFRETLKAAASYVNPLDVETVAHAIEELSRSLPAAAEVFDAPSSRYTWTGCVQRMRAEIARGNDKLDARGEPT